MALSKRFSSSPLGLVSIALAGALLIPVSSTGCGPSKACFYWTEAEGACPSQKDALAFFQGSFCQSEIASVDSEGTFDEDVCCYDVTENDNPFGGDCFIEPGPPPPDTSVSVGVGGAGGVSTGVGGAGAGGAGGAGGGGTCAGCAQFMTETMPPPLCDASVMLYEALTDCRCFGPCSAVCTDNACAGQAPSTDCENCMLDTNMGCGDALLACVNDT